MLQQPSPSRRPSIVQPPAATQSHTHRHGNGCKSGCTCGEPSAEALAALERARRLAFEMQEAERWDGMA